MIKKILSFLAKLRHLRIHDDGKPDVYWEIGDWGGGRLRYKNWAAVEEKYKRQLDAATALRKDYEKISKDYERLNNERKRTGQASSENQTTDSNQ